VRQGDRGLPRRLRRFHPDYEGIGGYEQFRSDPSARLLTAPLRARVGRVAYRRKNQMALIAA
jgi:hypothetical protein